jgi:PAS domain S-box-containing protein
LLQLAVSVALLAARPAAVASILLVLSAATLIALYLVRAGRIRAAALLFLIIVWCVAEVTTALGGGLRSGGTALIVLIIVNAGWLLGRSSAIALTAATLLIGLAEALALYFGHPLPVYFPGHPIGSWLVFAGTLLFAVNPILSILETLRRQLAALRESEERYRTIVDSINDAIVIHEIDTGRILDVNRRAREMFGYSVEEMRRLSVQAISEGHPPHSQAEATEHMAHAQSGAPHVFEWLARHRDGHLFWIDVAILRASVSGEDRLVVVARDITERKRAEDEREKLQGQLIEARKMESIGRLAGGVAHDFNNLLTVINGYSRALLDAMISDDPSRHRLEQINRAGERAATITKQLLAFSRRQILQPRVLDCNRVVADMQSMLKYLVGQRVELTVRLNEGATTVYADPHQLEQVFMNLATNARDAMPHGGRLLVQTAIVECLEKGATSHCGGQARGPYVMLAITDSGIGMDEETRRHIFEPFFTTKPVGEGTGLGLSMILGIVDQSGGNIEVESEPGRGTTFKIYLPKVGDKLDNSSKPVSVPGVTGTTVLLVEDQPEVRNFAGDTLRAHGYRVIQAENASVALRLCEGERERIDLVLTDVVMPDMGGKELADLLAEQRPGIKVLFMSGYTDNAHLQHGVPRKGTDFIQKPFSPDLLVTKVQEMLLEHRSQIPF